MQEINLQGSKVLVTGSARGLGESFVRALVAAGAQVVISDVLHERGQALAADLPEQHVRGVEPHLALYEAHRRAAIAAAV